MRQDNVAVRIRVIKNGGVPLKDAAFTVAGELDFGLVKSQCFVNVRHHGPHKN